MFPTVTLTPDLSKLDRKIAPLVDAINKLGMPTYYSCQGHGSDRTIVQSAYPMVALCPDPTREGGFTLLRVLGMVGEHNDSPVACRWIVFPQAHRIFVILPAERLTPLERLHDGIAELVLSLNNLRGHYNPRTF